MNAINFIGMNMIFFIKKIDHFGIIQHILNDYYLLYIEIELLFAIVEVNLLFSKNKFQTDLLFNGHFETRDSLFKLNSVYRSKLKC